MAEAVAEEAAKARTVRRENCMVVVFWGLLLWGGRFWLS